MSEITDEGYQANLAHYEKVIATNPIVERKGATMPYTSVNGHMFSLFTKAGEMTLRLPAGEREKFLEKYQSHLSVQYGTVMKEYVVVPQALLENTKELVAYFNLSYTYVSSLKPKPPKKKAKK